LVAPRPGDRPRKSLYLLTMTIGGPRPDAPILCTQAPVPLAMVRRESGQPPLSCHTDPPTWSTPRTRERLIAQSSPCKWIRSAPSPTWTKFDAEWALPDAPSTGWRSPSAVDAGYPDGMNGPADDPPLVIRPAAADELDRVLELLRSASAARARWGPGTWGTRFPDVVRDIPKGVVWLAFLDGLAVGTFVLRWSERRFGGPTMDAPAMSTAWRRDLTWPAAGLGPGSWDAQTRSSPLGGGSWLRLDCDRDNAHLRRYYEALGFEHVGDVDGLPRQTRSGWRSASLYQRPAPDTALDQTGPRRRAPEPRRAPGL
jgi:hypothetical protein